MKEQEKNDAKENLVKTENGDSVNELKIEVKSDDISREWMDLLDGTKVPVKFTSNLSDGRVVKVGRGNGGHAMDAQEYASENGKFSLKKYNSFLMSALISVDGKFLAPQDIIELEISDFNKINNLFMGINF